MRRTKRQIENEINKILRHEWNPIGFGDSLPEDEYTRYVPRVYEALSENCNILYLNYILMHISENIFCVKCDWHKTLKVSEKLITTFQKEAVDIINAYYNRKLKLSKKISLKYDNVGDPYK